MAKRAISKRSNVIIACATVTTLLMGISASAIPFNQKNDIAVTAEKSTSKTKRNVMYYGDWSVWGGQGSFYPKDIPADQLTHLNFAFLDFNANGELIFTDKGAACENPVGMDGVTWGDPNAGVLAALQDLRAKNPNLKIGISLGGWSKSGDFSVVASDASKRAKFVENVMEFIRYTNMDFVDLDWEYPGALRDPDKVDNQNDEGTTQAKPEDKENYILLLKDFRKALDKQGVDLGKTYELSVALPAPIEKVDIGIDVNALFDTVDFANIMTYDMRGAWDPISGHQTPLYTNPNDPYKGKGLSVDESVDYFISKGAEPEKIVVGAAYYTRGWEKVSNDNVDTKNPGLFGKAEKIAKDADQTLTTGADNEAPVKNGEGGRRGGVWSYRSLDALKSKYPGLKEYWDDTAKAPYLYNESTGAFFTYDNVKSIKEKCKYVNDNELGGMIGWMASQDAPSTPGSNSRDELTKATKNALYGNAELPKHEIVYDELDLSCTVETFKESWSDKGGYTITLKNNEKLEESGDVLRSVETTAETLKNAKIYIKNNGTKIVSGDYTVGTIKEENGYSVIDLGEIYSAKVIKPGSTYTMTLNTEKAPSDTSSLESISISQRMSPKGSEMGRQTVFGNEVAPGENTAPVIKGVKNQTLVIGDKFDPLNGVTAFDKEDGDLTSNIIISGTVDTSKASTYPLVYTVSDSKGLKVSSDCTIMVKDKGTIPNDNYDNAKIYNAGDKVIYKGKEYICKWWVQGQAPGTTSAWELIVLR
ncbi:MAG: glycosyl hydrolase family 18 protein [Clostridium sp.]|uniref:glycosyl hydrolase family 18 protein n=1 Tax=Clostridium sp. TaxID=1506 RepID=UPI002FC854E9